jgi:hypothetical protein
VKLPEQTISKGDGMQIDERDEQRQKADDSNSESLEPASTVTIESASHSVKQLWPSNSTDEGTQIDESDEPDINAPDPIDERREPGLNVMWCTV